MSEFQVSLAILCGMAALVLVADTIADRRPGNFAFVFLAGIEGALFYQLVWGIVRVIDDHEGVSIGSYLAYLIGAPFLLPAAYIWSASEKSRSGTAVLLVAVLVVPVLLLRLHDIWATHA